MPETSEDAALVEAIAQAIHDTDDMAETVWPDGEDDNGYRGGDGWVRLCLNPEAYRLAARRALRLSRAHDAPTLATLTASLAKAEARAGRAEAALTTLRAYVRWFEENPKHGVRPQQPWADRAPEGWQEARRAALQEPPHGR